MMTRNMKPFTADAITAYVRYVRTMEEVVVGPQTRSKTINWKSIRLTIRSEIKSEQQV